MLKRTLFPGILALLIFLITPQAHAVPVLQLGIGDGFYDPVTQTIVTQDPVFTLYAYGKVGAVTTDTKHYISIALTPQTGPAEPSDIGSFDFTGACVDGICEIGDMTYGTPPLEGGLADTDPNDLASHGIFETFFVEVEFEFSADHTTSEINTQDNPGFIPTDLGSVGALYFVVFDVDASDLFNDYFLHFDLYNQKVKNGKFGENWGVNDFAPFSHDAAYVPEPGSLALMGLGLLGLAFSQRKRFYK